jgi:hypothetical protein
MKITIHELRQVPVEDVELTIPQEPTYLFETGVRRAIRIIPFISEWDSPFINKGEVYFLKVTCVYTSWETKIEQFTVNVDRGSVTRILSGKGSSPQKQILELLLHKTYEERSVERFEEDFKTVLERINSDKPV